MCNGFYVVCAAMSCVVLCGALFFHFTLMSCTRGWDEAKRNFRTNFVSIESAVERVAETERDFTNQMLQAIAIGDSKLDERVGTCIGLRRNKLTSCQHDKTLFMFSTLIDVPTLIGR